MEYLYGGTLLMTFPLRITYWWRQARPPLSYARLECPNGPLFYTLSGEPLSDLTFKLPPSNSRQVICILVFGGWWADSTFMREHFRKRMHRFVK
jgi:hypothetical protein